MTDTQKETWNAADSASERTAALQAKLADARSRGPWIGDIYKHKKGGVYQVTGYAIDTDSGEVRVLYKRTAGPDFNRETESGIVFARNISEWTVDRFVLLT